MREFSLHLSSIAYVAQHVGSCSIRDKLLDLGWTELDFPSHSYEWNNMVRQPRELTATSKPVASLLSWIASVDLRRRFELHSLETYPPKAHPHP